jgi:arsenical-resistance protein
MGDLVTEAAPAGPDAPVIAKLSTLNRFLPLWILAAMAAGIGLGRLIPSLADDLDKVKIGSVSLPIAVGLLLMMYPVLAKVRYTQLDRVTGDRRLLLSSLVLNWVLGPALMFTLAWVMLPDLPAYRTGLIIVGLARCIAMVLIWNELACGDREAAAVLVALNSVFQIVAFAALGWFYLHLLPGWLGLSRTEAHFSVTTILISVLVFLGIPLLAGFLTRTYGERARGRDWYEQRFLPRIGPVALYGLLFTIVILFALQGHTITSRPWDVARIALPLVAYFAIMFGGSFALGHRLRLGYPKTTTLAFTAAGNNFELAIAVCIGVFGVTSGQALAGVVGPLIEVPVLVALVYVALWARRRFYPADPAAVPAPQRPSAAPVLGSPATPPSVLFVCVKNGGKSQMAAALMRKAAGRAVQVYSAGTQPGAVINAESAQAVAEIGADMTGEHPKPIDPQLLASVDRVIVLGSDAVVEPVEGMRGSIETWHTVEPSTAGIVGMPRMRLVRNDIAARVQALTTELLAPSR